MSKYSLLLFSEQGESPWNTGKHGEHFYQWQYALLTGGNYSQSGLEEHTEEQSTVFPKAYGYPYTSIVCQMHPVKKAYLSRGVGMCKPTSKIHFSDLQERWASQSAAEQRLIFCKPSTPCQCLLRFSAAIKVHLNNLICAWGIIDQIFQWYRVSFIYSLQNKITTEMT